MKAESGLLLVGSPFENSNEQKSEKTEKFMKRILCVAILLGLGLSAEPGLTSTHSAGQLGDDLLRYLPDGTAVAVMDFQKITGSALWASFSGQQKFKSTLEKAESEISDLGVKLTDVRALALVFHSASMNNPTVAITGGVDQSVLLERLRSSEKFKLTSEKYKGFDLYKVKSIAPASPATSSKEHSESKRAPDTASKSENALAFHDSNTIIIGTVEGVRASIDVMTGASPSIAQNRLLTEALAQNPSAAIRFAFSLTPAMTGALESSELPVPDFSSVKLIFGGIDVSAGVDLNATLRNDTAEHAKSIADRLNGLLSMAKGYLGAAQNAKSAPIVGALNTVNIVSVDIDVKITGSLPMDLLNSLFASSERKGK
jgi:hypothetical protein